MKEKTVLIYLEENKSYLMLFRNKKKHDINKNKWVGIGGHIEDGETPNQAIIREVKEETNLDLISLDYRGLLHFINNDYEEDIYLYTSNAFKGTLEECNEGELRFIPFSDLMSLNMWEGDKIFLPLLINNEPFFELTLIYNDDKFISYRRH